MNISGIEFSDISSEEYRVYEFAGKSVRIDSPKLLNVSKSGGHRILDASGISHYVPSGWLHLFWKARDGEPSFVL
jgi:hypothetical protein